MLHRAGDLYQRGQPEEAAQALPAGDRAPARHRRRLPLSGVRLLAGRPPGRRDPHARDGARSTASRHRDVRVKLGVYLAETGNAERAIQLLEGLAGDDIEALNALGIAYGQASRAADAIRTFKHVARDRSDQRPGLAEHRHRAAARRRSRAPPRRRCAARSRSTTRSPAPTPRSASCCRRPGARPRRSRCGSAPSR